MPDSALTGWIISALLLGLRIGPVFLYAPPFSLIRMPALFRVLFALGLSITLVSANPAQMMPAGFDPGRLAVAAIRELALGAMIVLVFQLMFAALYFAGRMIDIQAGYGLALLIDPTSRGQTPLVGTLFAYAAGAMFFAADGHVDLLRFLSASLKIVPIGQWTLIDSIGPVTRFLSIAFPAAFGVAGAAVLALFLIDIVIALLSRTVPQMNVLVLGFQVKTIVLLLTLPLCLGLGGAMLMRMMAMMLQTLPEVL